MGVLSGGSVGPDEIARHRLAPDFIAAVEAGDRAKAQRVMTKIFRDGQTGFDMARYYEADATALEDLKLRLPKS